MYVYIYIQTSKYFHYVNLCESLQAMARKSHVVDLCVTVAEMLKSLDKTTWDGEAVLGLISESVDRTTPMVEEESVDKTTAMVESVDKTTEWRDAKCSVDKTNLASTDFLFAALERCLQEGAERSWMASTDLLSAAL